MTSRGWFYEKSKGDYFYVHPQKKPVIIVALLQLINNSLDHN